VFGDHHFVSKAVQLRIFVGRANAAIQGVDQIDQVSGADRNAERSPIEHRLAQGDS
jgi:hypothetical protein